MTLSLENYFKKSLAFYTHFLFRFCLVAILVTTESTEAYSQELRWMGGQVATMGN